MPPIRGHARRRPARFVAVSLADTGAGIPADKLAPDLRAVLHHQGGRQGHRARASARSTASPSSRAATSRSRARSGRAPPSPSTCRGSTRGDAGRCRAEAARDGAGRGRPRAPGAGGRGQRRGRQVLDPAPAGPRLRDHLGRERGRGARRCWTRMRAASTWCSPTWSCRA